MKNTREIILVMVTVVFFFLLVACEKSFENDDSSNAESIENASTTDSTDTKEKVDTSNNSPSKDEDPSNNTIETSLKNEYVKKLNDTKKENEELEATDSSTYALKKVENDRWDAWDELLNEMYGALMNQLPPEEMDQLREEQRNWIKNRDDTALEESLKYEGGTQEHLEYVSVLANLTEERCYQLVEDYMK